MRLCEALEELGPNSDGESVLQESGTRFGLALASLSLGDIALLRRILRCLKRILRCLERILRCLKSVGGCELRMWHFY